MTTNEIIDNKIKFMTAMQSMSIVYYKHATTENPNTDYRSEPKYTFCADLVTYWNDPDGMIKYVDRMLNEYCKHNAMAYMELVDSICFTNYVYCSTKHLHPDRMGETIFCIISDGESFSNTLEKLYYKLMYNEEFINKYLNADEISTVWSWLN